MSEAFEFEIQDGRFVSREGLENVYLDLQCVMTLTGLSWAQILEESKSGRLQASGQHDRAGELANVAIRADHLQDWLERTGRRMSMPAAPAIGNENFSSKKGE